MTPHGLALLDLVERKAFRIEVQCTEGLPSGFQTSSCQNIFSGCWDGSFQNMAQKYLGIYPKGSFLAKRQIDRPTHMRAIFLNQTHRSFTLVQ